MKFNRISIVAGSAAWIFLCGQCYSAPAEAWKPAGTGLEFERRITGKQVLEAVEPLRDVLQQSSAAFFHEGDLVGYGIVMDESCILTKASLMSQREGMTIRIGESIYHPEEWSGVDEERDLVLVRVKGKMGKEAKAAVFSKTVPEPGTIVACNGATTGTRRRARIGMVGTTPHAVPHPGDQIPYMGVAFDEPSAILRVEKGSPAENAGLQPGDVIASMDGSSVSSLEDIGIQIDRMKPGAPSKWQISRGGKVMEILLTPGSRRQYLGDEDETDEKTTGRVSRRKYGFPRVIQHDASLLPSFMGGPLLDLKGRVVGMNIARLNRAETYALPSADLLEVYRRLRLP